MTWTNAALALPGLWIHAFVCIAAACQFIAITQLAG